ncbi:hypothetical protein FAZ15_12335 [Sphingobacterium olei]|uniref:Uncharacterized protein n=1 Tax=Sphingobacterium olei TaxID=2571155 RepID=A0A4U0P0M7_9SPHI|nr:hypothetical protein [Sphingobacterium olei]TJZ60766.1 hypothetical protein FAZ15_12335 [Sphingobacterium olei]
MKDATKLVLIILLALVFLNGCKDENVQREALDFSCLERYLDTMQNLLGIDQIEEIDGTYPVASATELENSLSDLKLGLSKAQAGTVLIIS